MSTELKFFVPRFKTAHFRDRTASTDIDWGLGATKKFYCRTLSLNARKKNDEQLSLRTLQKLKSWSRKNIIFQIFLNFFLKFFENFWKNVKNVRIHAYFLDDVHVLHFSIKNVKNVKSVKDGSAMATNRL